MADWQTAHERHRAELLGQSVHTDPAAGTAARDRPPAPLQDRDDIFAWLAACAMPGLNDITVKATPGRALALVRAAENGDPDEPAIAAQLTAFSDTNARPRGTGAAGRCGRAGSSRRTTAAGSRRPRSPPP
jgi:hypothetical protein